MTRTATCLLFRRFLVIAGAAYEIALAPLAPLAFMLQPTYGWLAIPFVMVCLGMNNRLGDILLAIYCLASVTVSLALTITEARKQLRSTVTLSS